MSEIQTDDGFIVDEETGEVRLATPKKIRVREKNTPQKGEYRKPPGKKKGAQKRPKRDTNPRKLTAILAKENTPEKIQQAQTIIKKSHWNVTHLAELAGIESAERVYKAIIDLAMDETLEPEVRGPFLKFVAERTIPKRITKLLSLPTVPKVQTLEDIEFAMQEIIRLMQCGELTHDECESLSRSYENLASIMSAKQIAVVQKRLLQVQDSLIKSVNKEVLLDEIDERLMEYAVEERARKFREWFGAYLGLDNLLMLIEESMATQDDKIKVLEAIGKICR